MALNASQLAQEWKDELIVIMELDPMVAYPKMDLFFDMLAQKLVSHIQANAEMNITKITGTNTEGSVVINVTEVEGGIG